MLFITPDFPPKRGGIQLLSHRMAVGASRIDATIVTQVSDGSANFDRAAQVRVHRAGHESAPRPLNLVTMNAKALVLGGTTHFDAVVCLHTVAAPSAALISRLRRIPLVLFLYASEVSDRPGLARWACSQADRIVAISRYTKQLALDAGAEESRVRIILPGVDVGALPPSSAGERDPVIVVVSRLDDRYKGHDVLLRAMPLLLGKAPEARLVVVGEGHLLHHLQSLTESYGISPAVTFTGAISATERDAWLDRARVFAMPSRIPPGGAGEGFGIAYLEAGAHRVPVVAGAVGGALDSVVDGETGVLIDPTDHLALAEALASLLLDSELAARLGDGGRARSESLSWSRAAADLERVLAEVASAS